MTITGTNYFQSLGAIKRYYHYLSPNEIALKIKNNEVAIGRPSGKTFLKEGRYFIEE